MQFLTGHPSSLQQKIKHQIQKLQDIYNLIDYQSTGVITAEMLNITLLHYRQEIPASELEQWINRADKDKNGNMSLSEFVGELTVEEGDDVSSGVFAELDHHKILSEHRDLSVRILQTDALLTQDTLQFKMFPRDHQLKLLAVGGAIPLEKLCAVCSLPPRKRTETELNELVLWLKQSTPAWSLVQNMSKMQMQELMRGASLVKVAPGEHIVTEGQHANRVVMVLDGHATLNRLPSEETKGALYLPWVSLRHEGVQVLSCFKSLAACAEILRPSYALAGKGIQVLSDMASPCQSAALWFERWMESLSTFKDDCLSVLDNEGVLTSLAEGIEIIETAWPSIEEVCKTFQLMRICEMLAKHYKSLFVDIQQATQSMQATARTLHNSWNRLKNIANICSKHQVSKIKQRTNWEGMLTQLDIQAEHVETGLLEGYCYDCCVFRSAAIRLLLECRLTLCTCPN